MRDAVAGTPLESAAPSHRLAASATQEGSAPGRKCPRRTAPSLRVQRGGGGICSGTASDSASALRSSGDDRTAVAQQFLDLGPPAHPARRGTRARDVRLEIRIRMDRDDSEGAPQQSSAPNPSPCPLTPFLLALPRACRDFVAGIEISSSHKKPPAAARRERVGIRAGRGVLVPHASMASASSALIRARTALAIRVCTPASALSSGARPGTRTAWR